MNEKNQFTSEAEEVLQLAQSAAEKMGQTSIGSEHILLGLYRQPTGIAHKVLKEFGLTDTMILSVLRVNENENSTTSAQGVTPRTKNILELAFSEASHMGSSYVGTEHLLLGILREGSSMANRVLRTVGIDEREMYNRLLQAVKEHSSTVTSGSDKANKENSKEDGKKTLEEFTRDLTEAARNGKLDPVIGRDEEIQRVIQILSRRTKNNPVLIGEPGVGKTAIAEGLAERIVAADVPEDLLNKKLLSLDISGMVAGTKYRGEFEERIKKTIKEVTEDGNIILFIDELHTIVGAGSAEGAVDAANILKPALSRGEIRVVGATTLNEYRKYIEKDAALERRFQPVNVGEPTPEATVEILKGIRDKYEKHHHLKISDEALESAVQLSTRYINDRFLPDKAIDLMDEAASKVRMKSEVTSPELKSLEEKICALHKDKQEAIEKQDFEKAAQLRDIEKNYQDQVEIERENWKKQKKDNASVVTADDIAAVVAGWTGIPVTRLTETESHRLLSLESTLHERVIGQDDAVTAVAKAIRRGRVGLKDPKRPIGSFLFLGPTGVGKTELCKTLAESMFGDENAMIRIDMSEYMEKHTVSRLVGSPPGYVGHEEGGQLTEKVRRKPYSVVLFDEIEKAHEDVWNILLQILDDGIVTDSQGRRVDFKNTVIVMTSNVGAKNITAKDTTKLGFATNDRQANEEEKFQRIQEAVMSELRRTFKPEFLNRIDETIVFHQLTEDDITKIAGRMIKTIAGRMENQGIHLEATDEAIEQLAKDGFDPEYGARPLRRTLQNEIEDTVAEQILEGKLSSGDIAYVSVQDGKILVEARHSK